MIGRPEMSGRETLEMMHRCSREIKGLRAQIAHLQPKADAYDNLATVLRLFPRQSTGMSDDLAYTLDRRISELTTELAKADQPTSEAEGE